MEVPAKKRQEKPDYARQPSSGSLSSLTNVQVNSSVSAHSQALFMQKIRESSDAVSRRDFRAAIQSYTEAIPLDPSNHILYTNRSAAFAKLQQYEKSLLDARKARELNPAWAKAYIREGSALQQLGQHADALAAFASGLANDAGNTQLLSGLTEAALKCPLKEKLEPIFQQLQKLKLDKSPFVIISVIGQELLQAGHYHASVQMLEASLNIGSCSLKLRGSVFSALSSAFWGMGNIDKAILYMQKDLQVAKSLGDTEGECRAYGNLGSAYFSKGHYKEALSHDKFQLVLAMRLKDRQTATVALGRLGHVFTAIGDYPNALQSHKQCVLLLKQSNEKLLEAREIGNVGAVYLAMGNFESAVECHLEHLKIAKSLKNSVEEARAHSNLGSAYHYKRNYEKAIVYHKHVLKIAEQKGDKSLEARAYAGLGHAARCMQDYGNAKTYHEKQLDNALQTRDKVAEGRACSNLGIIFHQLGEYEPALKLHKVHLTIAKDLGDRASQGRALGNIGNANCALKQFEQAIKFHKQELAMSTEVNDRHSEGSTHGNLAVAYQALKMMDSAHQHYVAHLNISRELKDSQSEARAVCNLGNFHSSRGEYTNSIPYYEQYLMLSQELHDSDGEAKACFCLGYAHFALGNFNESVRYYKQDLSIAQELKNQLGIARAVCNLGLAHKALDNFTDALECQKKCLQMMSTLKNTKGQFRALGNIGDIYLKTGDLSEAIKYYNQQLQLAKQFNNRDMTATANGSLGGAHRLLGQHDKALGYHTQELSIRQDMNDLRGECRAHGNIGSVHMCLGKYMNAYKCYEEQLDKSRELSDSAMEANACGNLAITKMNMGNFEEAIGLFEQQLAMLEQVHGANSMFDRGRAFGSLGDCYEALGDFDESIKCHEQYLAIAQNSGNLSDQDKAYRGLGNAHRSVGNLQQALVCFEKRLVVAHELNSAAAKASAYGELGCLHSLLGNFEQAISCLQHQLAIAREMEDSLCEGDAACGLGGVYQQMGEYEKALEYHEMDLKIAEKTTNTACQCRAYGNLGLSYESLGEYQKAIQFQEQHLSIAAQLNDRVAKTLAYSSLGRVHHALNNHSKAVEYLRQGLQIAEQLGRMEDEAKIRHRLGLALWGNNNQEECQHQLYKASELFESIRRDAQFNSEYKLSLFDLQTACYQALQRVLVTLNRHSEALVVAERACTRAFIDLLMERQAGSEGFYGNHVTDPPPITTDQITTIVGKQKSVVLYFSVAAGFLYSWLLTPKDGIVKFQETSMSDVENEVDGGDNISMKSSFSFSTCSLLDNFVGQVRESMGVESHAPSSMYRSNHSISMDNDSTSDVEEQWEQHLEELGDKLNADNDRTGFLRIVNRNHLFNSSNYSLGSLLSVSASLNGCNASFPGSTISRKNSVKNRFGNKSAISSLYQLLIEPFEESLKMIADELGTSTPDLILVLQGELYLIPFTVLRKDQTMDYLFERYNLIVVPSLTSLQNRHKHDKHGRPVIDSSGAVIVGNPKLTPSICQHWHLHDIPTSEYEARIVGEILTARPLIGQEATKGAVLSQIEQVEVIHFATHISWKLSSVILTPSEVSTHPTRFTTIDSDDSASDISSFDGPSLSEYLLTAADILNLKLHAKLVVLSAGYTDDRAGRINADGVVGLTRALLSAGAKSVLFCLWPVPDQASKLLMRSLYEHLSEGKTVSQALSAAMKVVQTTRQFSHPSNWGGWVMMGQDVKLSSKVAQMGHAICELLSHPAQCREAMRVLLHLIEKSLQRIHQGSKNSMYTTSQSIENKVGGLSGWKDLLQAVGFRFEPSLNGLPPAVFFPQTDPGSRLTQASASLQALLGLPQGSLQALSKFLSNYEAGETFIRVMRDVLSRMVAKENNMDVKVNVKLWRVPGCHEFLASLGMDLVEVGNDEITLRLGKQANKRHLQFALQSLVSVFDTQEAPRSLNLDSSSSLESLSSSQSGSTSTSNFSKGSTPPLSPRSKKKSLFNPAEMEKMRIRNSRMSQGGLTGRKVSGGKTSRSGVSDPSMCLQYQNQIKTMYRTGTNSPLDGAGSDVCVTALSDSDTPVSQAQSPLSLGSSSASERLQNLIDAESYELSLDGRLQKNDKVNSVDSHTGLFVVAEESTDTVHQVDSVEECEEQDRTFTRNSHTRNSDMSDNSSISQGIQADQDFEKRGSDISDVSVNSEGKVTPKNNTDLDTFLQTTDESGIVSETTSSNHSGSSHLEDQSNYAFDPAEIAQKIMMDVSDQKSALDSLQKFSMIQSHQHSNKLRNEFQDTLDMSTKDVSSNQSSMTGDINPPSSIQAKIAAFSGNNDSAFTSPSHKARVPPQLAAKPTFQSNASNFRNLSTNVSNLSTIKDSNMSLQSSSEVIQSESKPSAFTSHAATSTSTNAYTTQAIVVSKESFSSTHGTSMSFSSFRPAGKPSPVDSMSHLSSYRPDSTTSTSSYCSTPSSVKSVIYKPYGDQQGNESPYVGSNDSSSEPISATPSQATSGSPAPSSPAIIVKDNPSEIAKPKRDASPALSTCSSTSSKGGKQKKKVSFSDSEPSDTPSPSLNSSASSNLYFDMNNLSGSHSSQYSRQSSLNNSTDNYRSSSGQTNGPRPPPPSYQYALKNSSVLGKSIDPGNKFVTQTSRDSSNSSLNSSLDEPIRISSVGAPHIPYKPSNQKGSGNTVGVPHVPAKQFNNTSTMNDMSSPKVPSSPSRSQYPPVLPGRTQQFQNMPEIKPLKLTSINQPNSANVISSTYQTQPILYPRSGSVPQSPSKQSNNVPTLPRRQPPPVPSVTETAAGIQPGFVPMSPSRSAVLRKPLTSDMSPEEYIPPSPVRAAGLASTAGLASPHHSPAHYPPNTFPGSQNNNQNMGQSYQSTVQSQPNTGPNQQYFDQSPNQLRGQIHKNAGQGYQVLSHGPSNSDQTSSAYNSLRYQPSAGHQMSPTQNIPMQEFTRSVNSDLSHRYPNPVAQSNMTSNIAYNTSSNNNVGKQTSSNTRSLGHSGVLPSSSRFSSMSNIPNNSTTNANGSPVKKNPPVPPARIDSWSTMDKQGNQTGPNGSANGQGRQHADYFSNNQPSRSLVGPQFSPKRIPFNNDRVVPNSNNPQTPHNTGPITHQGSNGVMPQQFSNGSIPNFQQYPMNPLSNNNLPTGPLRSVDLGSDKRSFAKTNVIHASKC